MTTQPITIELPETVLRQLSRLAESLQQPIEALIAQSVLSNLPPSTDHASAELQPALLEMQQLENSQLQAVAQSQVQPEQHNRHLTLLTQNAESTLTLEEQQELASLRQAADQLMLRKAYAWSILRWRGQRIPALEALPVPQ